MPTIVSVDLASRRYADIGTIVLSRQEGRCNIRSVPLGHMEGRPKAAQLALTLVELAETESATMIALDGPQGWKDPENGLEHSRLCDRQLNTQGKCGLPGHTKPRTYLNFIQFSIDVFEALDGMGWPRLAEPRQAFNASKVAVESFPTAAWRSLLLLPLPSKSKATTRDIETRRQVLQSLFRFDLDEPISHDELQAIVAGFGTLALAEGRFSECAIAGVAPFQMDGSWREGFIVNPAWPLPNERAKIGVKRQGADPIRPSNC